MAAAVEINQNDLREVDRELRKRYMRALERIDTFAVRETKQLISTDAPKKLVGGRWRATVPATRGAPPRRVSGLLHSRIGFIIDVNQLSGELYADTDYAGYLEHGDHPFLSVIAERHADDFARIVATEIAR